MGLSRRVCNSRGWRVLNAALNKTSLPGESEKSVSTHQKKTNRDIKIRGEQVKNPVALWLKRRPLDPASLSVIVYKIMQIMAIFFMSVSVWITTHIPKKLNY